MPARPRRGAAVLALLVAFTLGAGLRAINDPDYWTHLAFGRSFVTARTLVIGEPFLAIGAAAPAPRASLADDLRAAVEVPGWPFQVALFAVRSRLGDAAVSVLAAICAAAAVALLARRLSAESSPERLAIGAAFVALAVFTARFRFTPRAETAGFVLLAAALVLVFRWGEEPRWRFLAGAGAVLLAWKPLHVTWTVGAALGGVALVSRPRLDFWRRQPRAALVGAATAAALVAVAVGRFAWFVLAESQGGGLLSGVTEMRPAWEFPSLVRPFAAVAACGLVLAWGGREGRAPRLAVWAVAAILGGMVVRNVALGALAMIPGAVQGLAGFPRRRVSRRRAVAVVTAAAAAVAWLAVAVARDRDYPAGVGVDWRHFPRRSAEYVRASAALGRPVFNSWVWGGYLDWAWNGDPRTFADGRLTDRGVLEDHDSISAGDLGPLDRRGIRTVLLQPVLAANGRLLPSVYSLLESPGWKLVDASDALVFGRAPLPAGIAEVPASGAWRVVLDEALLSAEQNDPTPHAGFTRAIALMELGDVRRALDAYEEAFRAAPEAAAEYAALGPILRARAGR